MINLPQKPRVILKEKNRAVFEIEDLYPGYGITLGNALRRMLLSSLPGAAITMVKIKGVPHEFTTVPGVLEDVVDLLLNIKQLRFRLWGDEAQRITLKAKGERVVTGKDITPPSQVEVVSLDEPIATLTSKKAELEMEMVVERGFGYVPVEARKGGKLEVGSVAVDAIFTPIRKVNFDVENMRVGDRTDYNRLRMHIETDGTITPEEALKNAVTTLMEQLEVVGEGIEVKEPKPPTAKTEKKVKKETRKKAAKKKTSKKKK